MRIDAFKCVDCGDHKSGLEVGQTLSFPMANPPRLEVTCKTCLSPKQIIKKAIEEREAKHTPGPWKAITVTSQASYVATEDASGPLAEIRGADHKANARLIACAPDLVESLCDCVSLLQHVELTDAQAKVLDNAIFAILKAKGGGK